MGLLSKIGRAFAMRSAVRELEEHPVLKAAMLVSADVFDNTGLREFSDETKETLANGLLEKIYHIISSDDKISTCRSHFTEAILELADYQVLILPPAPEEDPTGLRGTQGISGDLKPLLLEISKNNQRIKELMYGITNNPTYDDVYDTVLVQYWRSYWWSQTFTACRVKLGDNNSDEDRDWYRPFLHAQCVFSESLFRQDLELGPAPGIRDETLVPVSYSTFMNIVLSGDRFPDLAWREQFKKDIEDGSLLPPFPADLKSQSAETAF